jgi:cyanate lyase
MVTSPLMSLVLLIGAGEALLVPSRLSTSARLSSRPSTSAPRRCHARCVVPAWDADETVGRVERLLALKQASGMTFDEMAIKLGLTNTYTAQLFLGQAQLKPVTAVELQKLLPGIEDADLLAMQKAPMRGFNDDILKEPNVYRMYEAITHYGLAIKALINEMCGDGIMSAIDFYMDVGTTTGKLGEKRVVITFNGKFLPFIEQRAENNGASSPRD